MQLSLRRATEWRSQVKPEADRGRRKRARNLLNVPNYELDRIDRDGPAW
jgi:hypothetical protein